MSEDDIRTKVVYGWLAGCGYLPTEISVEYGFEIRLGRSVYRVGRPAAAGTSSGSKPETVARPRADVLVRRNGLNLFVVEVKAPGEPLDDDARDQGISYARLLPQIAPFVVLTNGAQSRLFDTITREELTGGVIPADHPTIKAGFRMTCDDVSLRAEALEWFVSLSPTNLLTCCQKQAASRMARLRDTDPNSGKKSIPSLYVERPEPWHRLSRLLDDQHAKVVAVVGRPQIGKTNFLCHFAEDRLSRGQPILFFPSVSLDAGLLDAIGEDFGWILGDTNPTAVLVNKLTAVVRRTDSRLTVFIDGWNEADLEVARSVDRACERLASPDIQIVISFTHTAARHLLARIGNPSFVAQEARIGLTGIDLIEADPSVAGQVQQWAAVTIEPYSDNERAQAYRRYAEEFRVTVPGSHEMTNDPYLLAVAMKHFAGQTLPDRFDEPSLLGCWLDARLNRIDPDQADPRTALTTLGSEMLRTGSPVCEVRVKRCWGLPAIQPIPSTFFEAALLAPQGLSGSVRNIDFYNSRDRDYVIACWSGRWPERYVRGEDCWADFAAAARSNAGSDALAWYFQQPGYLRSLLTADGGLPQVADPNLRRLFIDSVGRLTRRVGCVGNEEVWYRQSVEWAASDPDVRCRIEAAKLFTAFTRSANDLVRILPTDQGQREFVRGLLQVHAEYPITQDGAGRIILRALHSVYQVPCSHANLLPQRPHRQLLIDLIALASSDNCIVREAAKSCWGHLEPLSYIDGLRATVPGLQVPKEWRLGGGQRDPQLGRAVLCG